MGLVLLLRPAIGAFVSTATAALVEAVAAVVPLSVLVGFVAMLVALADGAPLPLPLPLIVDAAPALAVAGAGIGSTTTDKPADLDAGAAAAGTGADAAAGTGAAAGGTGAGAGAGADMAAVMMVLRRRLPANSTAAASCTGAACARVSGEKGSGFTSAGPLTMCFSAVRMVRAADRKLPRLFAPALAFAPADGPALVLTRLIAF